MARKQQMARKEQYTLRELKATLQRKRMKFELMDIDMIILITAQLGIREDLSQRNNAARLESADAEAYNRYSKKLRKASETVTSKLNRLEREMESLSHLIEQLEYEIAMLEGADN